VDVVRLVPTATSPVVVRTCWIVEPLLSVVVNVAIICLDALDVIVWMTIVAVGVGVDDEEVALGVVPGVEVADEVGVEPVLLGLEEVCFEGVVDKELVVDAVLLVDELVLADTVPCRFCKPSSTLIARAAGKIVNARRAKRNGSDGQRILPAVESFGGFGYGVKGMSLMTAVTDVIDEAGIPKVYRSGL